MMNRAQILALLKQRLSEEFTEAEVVADGLVLKRLGLLAQDLDYKKALLQLLTDQIAGFYYPERRTLNVAAWLPLQLQRPTLAHELCHALQDQHFGLERFSRPIKDNGDRQLARAALVEGDCTALMIEYVLAPTGVALSSIGSAMSRVVQNLLSSSVASGGGSLAVAPPFLRDTLTFPYIYGLSLIQSVRTSRRWSPVDQLFRRPPDTTEQVLHPAKLIHRERGLRISVHRLAVLRGYKLIKRDTLGEFQLQLLLRQTSDRQRARQAAAGWGGDRLAAYQQPGSNGLPVLIHLSVWDSEADALEFTEAVRGVLAKQTTRSVVSRQAQIWCYEDEQQQHWSVQRNGRFVLTLFAVPPDREAHVRDQLWKRWRVGGRPLPSPPHP